VGLHDLVLLQLGVAPDLLFVLLHLLEPLLCSSPEGGDGLPEEGVVGSLLDKEINTRMLEHFLETSSFVASTLLFSCAQLSILLLKNSFNLFFSFWLSSSMCLKALREQSSFLPYFCMKLFSLDSKMARL
jgi:hypothetical protein